MPELLYPRREHLWYTVNMKWGRPHNRSGHFWRREVSVVALADIQNPTSSSTPALKN
jgi:hypothetical protein